MTKPFAVAVSVFLLTAGACVVLLSTSASFGGPLTPPVGPVTSTPGPEPRRAVNVDNTPPSDAVDQFKITQPGSYYLESNISITGGRTWGIGIFASGVTLDLNGFTIDGNNAGNNGGIRVEGSGVSIRNGTIRNVQTSAIALTGDGGGSPGMNVQNIRVLDVSGPGSFAGQNAGIITGRGAIIRDCYVNNAPTGISTGFNANISGCTVEFARTAGMQIEGGAAVSQCVVVGTAGGTTEGDAFISGAGSSFDNCVARSNSGDGFVDFAETVFTNCRATANDGAGFVLATRSRMDGCHTVSNAGPGVLVASVFGANDWEIVRCSLSNNAAGIVLSDNPDARAVRGRIHDCTIRGISVFPFATIGIKVPSTSSNIDVTSNVFSALLRAVELEGSYCRVTNNSFNAVTKSIVRANGTAPSVSNFIGAVVLPNQTGTPSPFANTEQ